MSENEYAKFNNIPEEMKEYIELRIQTKTQADNQILLQTIRRLNDFRNRIEKDLESVTQILLEITTLLKDNGRK